MNHSTNKKIALLDLMQEYYKDYLKYKELPFVKAANATFPIIWFGDMERYLASPIKILTVGINPSNMEFSKQRFSNAEKAFEDGDYISAYNSLNRYFLDNPYQKWFSAYEDRIFPYLNTTYGGIMGKRKHCAIHVDIHSAIATNPKWGELSVNNKRQIINHDLFKKLLDILSPAITLVSVKQDDIGKTKEKRFNFYDIFGINLDSDADICENLPNIEAYKIQDNFIIWGKCNIKPFHGVNESDDHILSRAFEKILPKIREVYNI